MAIPEDREREIIKLIEQRSVAHVRELLEGYLEQKKEIVSLSEEVERLDKAYDAGYLAGLREMRDSFTDFLLRASAASTLKVAALEKMDPSEVLKLIAGEEG